MRSFRCPDVRTCLSFDGTHLWQVAGRPKVLRRIDPADGAPLDELPLDSEDCCGVEVAGERFWLTKTAGRLELRSLGDGALLAEFPAEPRIAGVALAGDRLWYTVDRASLLVAVEPNWAPSSSARR